MAGIYAIDFDDVLAFFSEYVYRNVKSNWRIYNKYFWDPRMLNKRRNSRQKIFLY